MLIHGDSIHIPLADNSVHMCVTSPPYWGLRSYLDDSHPLKQYELGLEPTPGEFVAKMVAIFREVCRVLRPDGTCWVNLGDSYATSANGRSAADTKAAGNDDRTFRDKPFSTAVGGLKNKDLCGIPWRVAFALQADGWWLRSDIIWAKPNPMPESVTDRPTKAHEYLFLLTKSERYFYDAEAVREENANTPMNEWRRKNGYEKQGPKREYLYDNDLSTSFKNNLNPAGRNRRSVWSIATEPYPMAHYATFPTKLVEPCILAGTSQYGCCQKCGAPWQRVIEKPDFSEQPKRNGDRWEWRNGDRTSAGQKWQEWRNENPNVTTGWRPGCTCDAPTVPAVVLDPFAGSGTVGQVARQLGRRFVGIDLNPSYLALNALPRAENKTAQKAIDDLPLFSFSEAAQ